MKKLLLIMLFVSFVFNCLLYSKYIQIEGKIWDKSPVYPLYKQVRKEELTEAKKHYYEIKTYNPSYKSDHIYSFETKTRRDSLNFVDKEYVTLKDEDSTALWTLESTRKSTTNEYLVEHRYFYSSSTGITAIRDYNSTNSFFWVDKQGNELNRLELKDQQTAYVATTLKDGEIWMIQTKFYLREWQFEEGPEENLDVHPNLSSLIFCDRNGNVLNTIHLKYTNIFNEKTISKSEDYVMYTCFQKEHRPNQVWHQYHSYIITYDGSILREYEDDGVWLINGSFSENEDIYVTRGGTDFIIDIPTGDIIASYKTHGRSAIAKKETGIIAVLDYGVLRIINYKANILLFHKKFDVYPYPKYVEITGDGKEVIVVTEDHLYTFRLKETNENY